MIRHTFLRCVHWSHVRLSHLYPIVLFSLWCYTPSHFRQFIWGTVNFVTNAEDRRRKFMNGECIMFFGVIKIERKNLAVRSYLSICIWSPRTWICTDSIGKAVIKSLRCLLRKAGLKLFSSSFAFSLFFSFLKHTCITANKTKQKLSKSNKLLLSFGKTTVQRMESFTFEYNLVRFSILFLIRWTTITNRIDYIWKLILMKFLVFPHLQIWYNRSPD